MAVPLQSVRSRSTSQGISIAFLGAFVVGSLAVQLVASRGSTPSQQGGPAPVVAHPSTLWSALGES